MFIGKTLTPQEAIEQEKLRLAKEKDKQTFVLDVAPEEVQDSTDWNLINPDYYEG